MKKNIVPKMKPLKKGITRACIHARVHSRIYTFTPGYTHTRVNNIEQLTHEHAKYINCVTLKLYRSFI